MALAIRLRKYNESRSMMELIDRFYFWRSLLHSLSSTLFDKNGVFAAVNRSDKISTDLYDFLDVSTHTCIRSGLLVTSHTTADLNNTTSVN